MWSRSIFAQRFTRGLHRDENNCRKNDGIFKDEEKKGTEKQSSIFYRPIQDLFHSSSHPARSSSWDLWIRAGNEISTFWLK